MSLLRVLRNLGVLVILTVGGASLVPRPMAAQSTCTPRGDYCSHPGITSQCCSRYCGPHNYCCFAFEHEGCTNNRDCCSGICLAGGRCY